MNSVSEFSIWFAPMNRQIYIYIHSVQTYVHMQSFEIMQFYKALYKGFFLQL